MAGNKVKENVASCRLLMLVANEICTIYGCCATIAADKSQVVQLKYIFTYLCVCV